MKFLAFILATILPLAALHVEAGEPNLLDLEANETTVRDEARRSFLVGTWYRKQATRQGGYSEERAELANDGTYRFSFRRTMADGTIDEYVEIGYWGLVDDIHFTIATGHVEDGIVYPNDMTDPRGYDIYEVLSLTGDSFRYRHRISGNTYELQRVRQPARQRRGPE